MKLALITGSSGHVGSNLIRKLAKLDYKFGVLILMGTIELMKVMMLKS